MNLNIIKRIIPLAVVMLSIEGSVAQEEKYFPKGDPDGLNIEINPFLWLPVIQGNFGSDNLSEDFEVPAVDLLSNLRFAFMFNVDVSKGKFFTSPSYIYCKLASEEVKKTDKEGNPAVVSYPGIVMNIFELPVGVRLNFSEQFYLDPYIGFRYTSYKAEGRVEGIADTSEFEETKDYFDPILGMRMHYYPHPRVPLTAKLDIGGFGAGSTISWTTALTGGYTLSPTVDLLAGFIVYGSDFEEENRFGNKVGLNLTMLGFNLGARIMIPARYRDAALFKKVKK